MNTKAQQINEALTHVSAIMTAANTRQKCRLEYRNENYESVKRFTEFTRERLGILPGMEYIYVYDSDGYLLYAVNVTADSVLTAIAELMDLISRKF